MKAKTTRRSVCFYINVAVYSRQTLGLPKGAQVSPRSHSVVARLQFSRGSATRHKVGTRGNPKAFHHNNPQGRRQEEAFGREELSSWNPNDAQSPSDGVWTIQLNGWNAPRAGGLVRLVLRIVDWYTSCSSLNLPSAEYAGDTNVNWQPLVSWFVFQ